MNDRIKNERELVDAIHELPKAMPPRRDLWPSIAQRLGAQGVESAAGDSGPRWRYRALAASVAIAFTAGLLIGRQTGVGDLDPAQPVADPSMLAALEASEREYQAAFREFIPVGVSAAMLDSDELQKIEGSWSDFQQAEAALMAAIREYPENTYLNQKLLDLRAQQLGFLKQLATLDQASRRKT